MAQCEAKFDWPRDQFLRFRVQWPSERGVKCENGKLKRGSQLEFGSSGMGREATSKPSHLLSAAADAKGCGTRKVKGRAKTNQLQDELPEWYYLRAASIFVENADANGWATHPESVVAKGRLLIT
jgi:hypothetical protein